LIFLLKARRPEKYKDRVSTEHRGTVRTFEQWLDEINGAITPDAQVPRG
jgi:hypothetical protein